jgi:hypothetical protein
VPRVVTALRAGTSPLNALGVVQPPTEPAWTGAGATAYVKGVLDNVLTQVVQNYEIKNGGQTTGDVISIT